VIADPASGPAGVNFVSRKKEHRADELACLVAGSAACIQGVRKIHGEAWPGCLIGTQKSCPYWSKGAGPIESQIAEGKTNPYDTHPPLHDRITAIERLRIGAAGENS